MYKIILEKEYYHFCSAHFIILGEKEKEMLHGHNYYVSVEFIGTKIDEGKLIDVSLIKPDIKNIIRHTSMSGT